MIELVNVLYVPFKSSINPSFWHKFTELKLDVDRLSDATKPVWGYYQITSNIGANSLLNVDSTSFNSKFQAANNVIPVYGYLVNKNTIEDFKNEDKVKLVEKFGEQLWNQMIDPESLENPSLLNIFFIISFADLKKYKYYYWFGFPTIMNLNLNYSTTSDATPISEVFPEDKVQQLYTNFNQLQPTQKPFFVVHTKDNAPLAVIPLKDWISNLSNYDLNELYFGMVDPSDCGSPMIILRNYIAFLLHHCPTLRGKTIKVLSYRVQKEHKIGLTCKSSRIFTISLPDQIPIQRKWAGLEKNAVGNFGPRMTNLAPSMDPKQLAETSVDLNLKLIKWRLIPDLDLDVIKAAKCLILGSGTLGCSVARTLLGWGVRTITFVDNGCVSYSNPVRQSLFTVADCLKGGKQKALAAAEALKTIFPGVNAEGFVLNIPMPGHSVGESLLKEVEESVNKLSELIESHDVVFLLMDSRESRWLPTLLGCHYKKIVLNAALGFDTYLVMRHGYRNVPNSPEEVESPHVIPGSQLGCYFCNDVTAPGNSLKDRTLDQQCTVTRPGISAIAGALVVELMISILSHKDGGNAKAYIQKDGASGDDAAEGVNDESLLGIVPHSIRGFLSTFSSVLPATPKYEHCIACSDIILNEFQRNGFEFLLKVFNSAKVLEDLTGLTEMQNLIDTDADWAIGVDADENFTDSDGSSCVENQSP